jgi:pimeloyl-ACP methyl ester carboxylesterase
VSIEPPVVLVHGFLSSPQMLWPFRWRLERYGFRVFQPRLSLLCIQDVRKLAEQLREGIEEVCEQQGVDEVDLVGVSQGGIIGLYYLHHLGGANRVRRLVAAGAPLRGTYAALGALPLLGLFSAGLRQLVPGSQLLQEISGPVPLEWGVSSVSVRGDFVSPPSRCAIEGAVENQVIAGPIGPFKHQWMALSSAVVVQVVRMLSEGGPDPARARA